MLSLPLPLRPEHRIAHFIASIQSIPLSSSHHHLNDLEKCASIEQPWLLSSATVMSSSSFVSKQAHKHNESIFASLAVHQQKQLSILEEESQRLVWLHEFCAAHCLSDCTHSHKSTPHNSAAAGVAANIAQTKTVPPPLPGAARLPFMFKKAAAAPPSCPLLLLRMSLSCRLPDHVLRLLKWLVQAQIELKQQKTSRADTEDPHSTLLVAQIDRILLHCAMMEEACWKLLWQMEQMIKLGVMSSCTCKMGYEGSSINNESQSFSPWWNHDCMNKVLRIIASHHHLSETSIYAFIDILLGERSLFLLQSLSNAAAAASSSGPPSLSNRERKHRTWKTKSFQHPGFVTHFLMGLAHTKGEITHQGLEFMCMMLLRVPENAQLVLRQNDWQRSIAHLLMRGSDDSGAIGTSSASSRDIVHRTLMEILNKEESSAEQSRRSSITNPSGYPSGSPSASPSASPTAATLSPEQLLSTNIKLSINIWVLLHFAQFNSSAAEHDSSADFEALLYESFDAIEDEFGWTPATALLVRVLLCSLVTKINSSSQKRILRNDIHHASWSALFDLFTVCENFIFYSPICHNQPSATPSPYDYRVESMQSERAFMKAHPESKGASALPEPSSMSSGPITMTAMNPDRRRSITSMIGNDSSVNPSQSPTSISESSFAYAIRSKDNRRFKSVGVHVSQQQPSTVCEDQILVDKLLELVESLKFSELELSVDANAQVIDRERVKKLKKMGLYELEFFQATNAYFKTLVNRGRTTTMEWEGRPTASSVSSSVAVGSQQVRSVPELLEKRRHQRELSSGGGWGGMFQNFTRSRRVLSMEQKLKGYIQEKTDTSQVQQKDESSISLTRGSRLSDAHRPSFHDGTNTKMNVDLVKMKIESHYLKHRKSVPQPKILEAAAQLPTKVQPPEIPKQRPHPSVFKRDVLNVIPDESPIIVAPVFNFPGAKIPSGSPQNRRQSPSSSSTNQRRQLSKGVPVTSLVQLMNRPLPRAPPDESSSSIGTLNLSDRNVTGPIILSPTNRSRIVEPKEEPIDELDERKEDGDLSLNDADFESQESISLQIPRRSTAAALHCAHCNIDLGDDPTVCYSTNEQLYCRMCFLIQFCCCASCGQLVETSQEFVRVTGTEHLENSGNHNSVTNNPELQPLISSDANVIEEMGANRKLDEGRNEFIFYHMDCLTCVQCDHDRAHRRSNADTLTTTAEALTSPVEEDALIQELMDSNDGTSKTAKKKWYSKLGRIYCESHYTNLFGANCAQCRQRISPADLLQALNQTWHRDCFACAGGCGRKLTEKTAFIAPTELLSATIASPTTKQGHKRTASTEAILSNLNSPQSRFQMNRTAYCETCFSSLFEVCHFCETALSDSEKSVMVKYSGGSRPYHAHCYQCIVCKQSNVSNEKLYAGVPPSSTSAGSASLEVSTEKPQLYCLKHYTETFFPKCPTCDQAVVDEEKGGSICVNDVEYHRACLNCHVCSRTLDPETEQIYTSTLPTSEKQILLCQTHQGFETTVKCHACSEMIVQGSPVEWKSNHYHANCLSCSVCQTPLSGESILTDSTGKFFCATHQPQIAPIAKTKEFRPPKLLGTKYSTLSSSSPMQFPDSGQHVKDLPPVEGAINPPIRAYHTAMPDTFKPQSSNPSLVKSPPSGHKFATMKANFHSPPPPIISPKAASAPIAAPLTNSGENCAQCSKSLAKGNLVELNKNSAQKYHLHCLYCSMCRVPFNANKLSAFEVHADTNKLYCTNCIRKVK